MAHSVIKPITLYKVEVGVLLPKKHEEYEDYSQVYDKKHAFYDENTLFFTNKEKAITYAKRYVRNGVVNTYGIVSALNYDPVAIYGEEDAAMYSNEDMQNIEDSACFENNIDVFGDDNWDVKNVIFNIYKPKERGLATNIF